MKVLHIIASVDRRSGGPVEGIFASASVWLEHGHVRHVLTLDPPEAACVVESPVPTVALGLSGALWRRIPFARYAFTPKLTRWLQNHATEYDAIIINGLWNYASVGAWRALRRLQAPYFVFTHGMLDPWFNSAYPFKTFHKRLYWRLFEHRVLRDAQGVLFTTEEERCLASSSFSPYRAREFVVGYGTSDPGGEPQVQRDAFAAAARGLEGRRFLLFLGRIHEKKGVDLLFQAFAHHASSFPEIDLAIAGPDLSNKVLALKKQVAALGLNDRVYWLGMVTGDAKWGAFRAADAFVLPSHQENFGVAVAEALAMGKPVLITNKVNIWREVMAAGAGIVVDDDRDGVVDGLGRLLAMSASERENMGVKGRKCFDDLYDLRKNAMSLVHLIENVVRSTE